MTENEKTAPNTLVGASVEQSCRRLPPSINNSIIAQSNEKSNTDFYKKMIRQMTDPSYLPTISMPELYENVYDSKPPIVDGLLYAGTYLFAGAPKVGKSFFMLQLAYHVSTGMPLWNYPVRKGSVLYLALEDNYHRLQERLYRMFGTDCAPDLHFSITAHQLGRGLNEQLEGFMREHADTRLVIVDTLQKVREISGDGYSYSSDYEIITQLKQFADRHKICLLLVHHTRKQKADDTFDMISGTNGLLGAADGAFLLYKEKRTSNKAVLEISGRDQQDQKINLTRNEERLAWDFESTETELWKQPPDPLLEIISKFLGERTEWQGTATELVELLKVDMKPNVLTLKINVTAGRLLDEYGIAYDSKRTHNGRRVILRRKRDDV